MLRILSGRALRLDHIAICGRLFVMQARVFAPAPASPFALLEEAVASR